MEASIGDTILEATIGSDGDSIYRSFVEVVSVNNYHCFAENLDTNPILKSMNLMTLKKREKGSGLCKFNTLNGRWFKKEMSVSVGKNEEENSTIERGRVVKLYDSHDYFLVFEVWKQMSNKKMYPSERNDILVWPLEKEMKESKKYRIGLRRMTFDESTKMVTYIGYGDSNGGQVEDGKSVHTTYFMVKDLKTVAGVYIKLDI